jgi:hypothetical protein
MKISIDSRSQFSDQFRMTGRITQFSYEALSLLYDFLEDTDPDYELDVIALCCEYEEQDWDDIASSYDIDLTGFDNDDEEGQKQAVFNYLNDNTTIVGETNSGFIYAQF